jgi:AraC-like DNA-binding protein
MRPLLEAPKSDLQRASLVIFERKEKFAWNWHYHPEIELTWIQKGSGTRLVGDHSESYRRNDLVLLGSNLPHTWFSREETAGQDQAVVIQLRPQLFSESILSLPEFAAIAQLLARAGQGLRFSEKTGREVGAQMKKLLRLRGLPSWMGVIRLLNKLSTAPGVKLASSGYQRRHAYKESSRLERVTTYIEKHCCDKLSLADAAKITKLTPSAFSRFFRKMTQKTFVSYRNSCRIREACRMLTETDRTITQIAFECGFDNLANFNRRFRAEKYLVPREYRRMHNPVPAKIG